ncbi:MAG: MarR family transcriptional regulator [Candidatus Aenigmatarchaeota archaeon]
MTPRAKDVLMELLRYDEVTNKTLSEKTGIRRSNVSTYIAELTNAGCVYLRRKNGKDKFWSSTPKMKWYLLQESGKQKSLTSF